MGLMMVSPALLVSWLVFVGPIHFSLGAKIDRRRRQNGHRSCAPSHCEKDFGAAASTFFCSCPSCPSCPSTSVKYPSHRYSILCGTLSLLHVTFQSILLDQLRAIVCTAVPHLHPRLHMHVHTHDPVRVARPPPKGFRPGAANRAVMPSFVRAAALVITFIVSFFGAGMATTEMSHVGRSSMVST